MPTDFAEDCEDEPEDLRKAIDFALDLSEEFRTDYRGNWDDTLNGVTFEDRNLNVWDALLSGGEREKLADLDPYIHELCPHLQKARGSEYFFYCGVLADAWAKQGTKFFGAVANKESAEYRALHSSVTLRKHCTKDFSKCEYFLLDPSKMEEVEKNFKKRVRIDPE